MYKRITSMGHFHPPNKVGNDFFDSLDIGSDAKWVAERTGIDSRNSVLSKENLLKLRKKEATLKELRETGQVMPISEMAKNAWSLNIKRDSDAAENMGFLFCGTSVPDFDIPANACTVGAAINVECPCVDINSACSSFVMNLHFANKMCDDSGVEKVLVTIPERYSLRLDYNDRSSCVLFGDACATAVIENNPKKRGFDIVDTFVTSAPAKYELVQIPVSGEFYQNGAAVQRFAITRTIEVTQEVLKRNKFSISDVDYLIGHQANLRMLTTAAKKLGIPEEKHLYNVNEFGNQGGAGAPSVLSMNWDKFKDGDLVVVSVVGAGLTWASALLRFHG